jgi:hypothetical protein
MKRQVETLELLSTIIASFGKSKYCLNKTKKDHCTGLASTIKTQTDTTSQKEKLVDY